jgi:hypothetical protein
MANSSIYGFLNDVTLGNGSVYNFIDYIGEMHVSPGIKVYSQDRRFLESNIFNNFENGRKGRYGYGGSRSTTLNSGDDAFGVERIYGLNNDKIYGTDGVKFENGKLSTANLTQDRVGEYYTVNPTATNSNMHFMTEYEFGDMSELIRNNLLKLNISTQLFKNRYLGDFDKFVANGMRESGEIGDDIVNTSFRKEYQRFYLTRKPLFEASDDFRDNLLKYRSAEPYHKELGFTGLEYSDGVEFPRIFDTVSWGKRDLLTYYSDTRLKAMSLGMASFPYGVQRESVDIYKIGDTNTYTGTSIDPKISAGNLVKSNISRNSRTYSYYEEPDGDTPSRIKTGGHSTPSNFVPQTDNFAGSSRLLQKTNELFRQNKIKSLVNRFHTQDVSKDDYDLYSAYSSYGLSRGRNLLRGSTDKITGYDNPYCRVWTAAHQYSKMKDMIRPFRSSGYETVEGVQKGLGKFRTDDGASHLYNNTVLQDSGFVRFMPQHNSAGEFEFAAQTNNMTNLARYMFSIENLAWKNSSEYKELSIEQRGPNGGRIMWFPPYNLSFQENINVSWKDHDFIGRGEKIYTYTNTERGGTLDFTILIDHPSAIDRWRGSERTIENKNEAQEDLLRFFAGCSPTPILDKELKPDEKIQEEETVTEEIPSSEPKMEKADTHTFAYYLFFPNNFSGVDYIDRPGELIKILQKYEFNSSGDDFLLEDGVWEPQRLRPENEINHSLFSINVKSGFKQHFDEIKELIGTHITDESDTSDVDEFHQPFKQMLDTLSQQVKNGKAFQYNGADYEISSIDVYGFASSHGYTGANASLFKNRQNTMINIIQHLTYNSFDNDLFITEGKVSEIHVDGVDVNDLSAKIARSAVAVFHVQLKSDAKPQNTSDNANTLSVNGVSEANQNTSQGQQNNEYVVKKTFKNQVKRISDEYLYFSQIQQEDEFVYNNIIDKIQFFDPAFHSMTPEGFNGRLSFLQQCTRQGPTRGRNTGGQAWNLAFGMQPYCILRIGDFFHTKICITALSVTYDNDGIRWDLNPEGAGVQPMMAKVSINFNFVGGQDLGGPVEELQNAISENYYANTSIFNNRSTKIRK